MEIRDYSIGATICEGKRQTKITIDLFLPLRSNNVHPSKTAWFCLIFFHF